MTLLYVLLLLCCAAACLAWCCLIASKRCEYEYDELPPWQLMHASVYVSCDEDICVAKAVYPKLYRCWFFQRGDELGATRLVWDSYARGTISRDDAMFVNEQILLFKERRESKHAGFEPEN